MYASVIVPTYNRRDVLELTLDRLARQTLQPGCFEIIVVDDHSADDTPVLMERLQSTVENLHYIRHEKNTGRVQTRNDGILASRGDLLVFLDDDNLPDRNFVEAHMTCHQEASPERIAVMGHASFDGESVASSNFARYVNSQYLGNRPPTSNGNMDFTNLPGHFFGTLNSSARREDVIRVGMFDTALRFYGFEDSWLGHCLRRSGVRIVFCEKARSSHRDDVSICRYRLKYREATREGLSILHEKDPGFVEGTGLRMLMPVQWGRDSLITTVRKLAARGALNSPTVWALELWARGTDHYPVCYSALCFRALQAGWYLQGLRRQRAGRSEVHYDPR